MLFAVPMTCSDCLLIREEGQLLTVYDLGTCYYSGNQDCTWPQAAQHTSKVQASETHADKQVEQALVADRNPAFDASDIGAHTEQAVERGPDIRPAASSRPKDRVCWDRRFVQMSVSISECPGLRRTWPLLKVSGVRALLFDMGLTER